MNKFFKISLVLAVALVSKACDDTPEKPPVKPVEGVTKKEVIANYAKIVHQNYKDSYDAAVALQGKINAFTASPTEATMKAAKDSWIAARDTYGQTEVFRGSNGPVDSEGGESWSINNEGQMNAWPLDEGYIDYTTDESHAYAGDYNGGIIAGTEAITKELLAGKNEGVNDKSVSTGWHAIEFLLWGQDETLPSALKAGERSFTDYTTADHKDRRATYLKVVTELLVDDLKALTDTWATGGTYNKVFMGLSEDVALKNIVKGPFFLANEELSEERMSKPVDLTDGIESCGQEDEHSCFSDNTHRDVLMNSQGIVNVLFGKYGSIKGASVYDLILAKDPTTAATLKAKSDAMMAAINTIDAGAKTKPFDLLLQEESATKPGAIMAGASALKTLGDNISASVTKIGLAVE